MEYRSRHAVIVLVVEILFGIEGAAVRFSFSARGETEF